MKVNFSRLNNGLEINKKQGRLHERQIKKETAFNRIEPRDLDMINEALKILP
ncbi:hypothetical protein [uncultured Methanobrevibacter sp.]|uniref:hypothetical protein n=1 Tax=uncultured Methanobrevibacter sp. TaxID=253161 RepID=UPI0025E8F4C3|nr:hypothetical protein [uncultured Methanobrevibacter sp.]